MTNKQKKSGMPVLAFHREQGVIAGKQHEEYKSNIEEPCMRNKGMVQLIYITQDIYYNFEKEMLTHCYLELSKEEITDSKNSSNEELCTRTKGMITSHQIIEYSYLIICISIYYNAI